MKRSDFLKSIIGKGLLLTSPLLNKKDEIKLEPVLIYKEYVAGFQFADGMKVQSKMKEGDELHLVREPENIHDKKAVAVYWSEYKIGYVPAIDNKIPNEFLLKGLSLRASIDKLNIESKPWRFCKASVFLLYPKELMQKISG